MAKAGQLVLIVSLVLVTTAANAAASVPELDPGSASMGLALLAGGLLVLNGRRFKP